MPHFHFAIDDMQVGACGVAALILSCDYRHERLHVRLTQLEAQALSAELARLPTGRTRLSGTIGQLLQHTGATNAAVQLTRGQGNMVEANLVASIGLAPMSLPLAFADAVVLAKCAGLPLLGDESLEPLLRAELAVEPDAPLPAAISAFLNTLPDLSV